MDATGGDESVGRGTLRRESVEVIVVPTSFGVSPKKSF